MSGKKLVTVIKTSDYDKLKKWDEIELVVEAKNRPPMRIFASLISSNELLDYENTMFNDKVFKEEKENA